MHQFCIDLVHEVSRGRIYGDVKQVEGAKLSPCCPGVLKGAETLCRRFVYEREGLCGKFCIVELHGSRAGREKPTVVSSLAQDSFRWAWHRDA